MKFYTKGAVNICVSDKKDGSSRDLNNELFQDFFFVKQIHSGNIHILENKEDIKKSRTIEADGIITKLLNVKIGVELADCNGIIAYGKEYIGVFHAGWKGIYNEIIENGITLLISKGENINNLKIFVGPSIRDCCYEVSEEFLDYFSNKYFQKNFSGKLNFNMIKIIKNKLDELKIKKENIEIINICTKCTNDYFSYRNGNLNERFVVGVERKI